MSSLVLASASPRRAELLRQLGVSFERTAAHIDERRLDGEPAPDYVVRLAREKSAAARRALTADSVVLAADTCVAIDDLVLGKPEDRRDALDMLTMLSGREHRVFTAVCLRGADRVEQALSESRVRFVDLTADDREAYLRTDEPWDKAGAYAVQGLAGAFVERISGSYSGIVGLPLAETRELLRRAGVATALSPT